MAESVVEEWIRSRYGPVRVHKDTRCDVFVAAVPIYRGVALGVGWTREQAVANLQRDLKCEPATAT